MLKKRPRKSTPPPTPNESEEAAQEIATETRQLELEKLQRKLDREERKKRREIQEHKQKKAIWLLPTLLLITMLISWILSNLSFPT